MSSIWAYPRRAGVVAFTAVLSLAFWGTVSSSAAAAPATPVVAPATISVDILCNGDVWINANVGDTIVFTMKHPDCNGDQGPIGNYANFNNLNGSYYSPPTYTGNATGAGFLTYVSKTGSTTYAQSDYWGSPSRGSQDDWYVMQSGGGLADVSVTTTLRASDGNGDALVHGSVIGDVYTEDASFNPTEYNVRWAGPRNASTITTAPSLPSGQKIMAVGYDSNVVGEINSVTGAVDVLPQQIGTDAQMAEGAGYDPVTGKTWVMQDCQLHELNADGSTVMRIDIQLENNRTIFGCWGFTPIGDGRAYLTGRDAINQSDEWKLYVIDLADGLILSETTPQDTAVVGSSGTTYQPWELEATELAYNPASQDLWVAGYLGLLYRMDPSTGVISNLYEDMVVYGEWVWGMAVDSNNVIWASVGYNVGDWDGFVAFEPENNWARIDLPGMVISGTTTIFNSDAMWMTPPTTTSLSGTANGTNPAALAHTGVNPGIYGALAAALSLFGVGILARGNRRRLGR